MRTVRGVRCALANIATLRSAGLQSRGGLSAVAGAATPPPPASPPASSSPSADAGCPAGTSPPPPAADAQPPAAGQAEAPSEGLSCGGFFFALDPNVGLWNDRVNPNWRLTFTDRRTREAQRVPYSFSIQHRGPHAELAVRFQFGFVLCEGSFDVIPQTFSVERGWEVTFPLPLTGIRFCHTVIRADIPSRPPIHATIYCVDSSVGLCAGFQMAVSGVGVKGVPELSWRGDFAMIGFIAMTLWGIYSLVTLPSTWLDFIEDLMNVDSETQLAFDLLDVDGDGYITRDDIRAFVAQDKSRNTLDVDELFDAMDPMRSGRVSYEEFESFVQAVQDTQRSVGVQPFMPKQHVELKPFGGAFSPGPSGPGLMSPLLFPSGPTGPGPKPPAW